MGVITELKNKVRQGAETSKKDVLIALRDRGGKSHSSDIGAALGTKRRNLDLPGLITDSIRTKVGLHMLKKEGTVVSEVVFNAADEFHKEWQIVETGR